MTERNPDVTQQARPETINSEAIIRDFDELYVFFTGVLLLNSDNKRMAAHAFLEKKDQYEQAKSVVSKFEQRHGTTQLLPLLEQIRSAAIPKGALKELAFGDVRREDEALIASRQIKTLLEGVRIGVSLFKQQQ